MAVWFLGTWVDMLWHELFLMRWYVCVCVCVCGSTSLIHVFLEAGEVEMYVCIFPVTCHTSRKLYNNETNLIYNTVPLPPYVLFSKKLRSHKRATLILIVDDQFSRL